MDSLLERASNLNAEVLANMEDWLIKFFGSYDNAVKYAHLYTLEYSAGEMVITADGGVMSTQTVTIRRKTQEELEGESPP